MAMVSRCNIADGRPAACPEGAPQAVRLRVTVLGKDSPFPARRALIRTACGALHVALSMKVLVLLFSDKVSLPLLFQFHLQTFLETHFSLPLSCT